MYGSRDLSVEMSEPRFLKVDWDSAAKSICVCSVNIKFLTGVRQKVFPPFLTVTTSLYGAPGSS